MYYLGTYKRTNQGRIMTYFYSPDPKFWSKHNLMLDHTGHDQSENGATFSGNYHLMVFRAIGWYPYTGDLIQTIHAMRALWATNPGNKYRTIPEDPRDRFSLDNALGVAMLMRKVIRHYKMEPKLVKLAQENMDALELFADYTKRPDTFAAILLAKYPLAELLILPRLLVSLSCIIACARPYDDWVFDHPIIRALNDGKPYVIKNGATGKQLSFMRYEGLEMGITRWICEKLTDQKFNYDKYYPLEDEHPARVLATRIWGARQDIIEKIKLMGE